MSHIELNTDRALLDAQQAEANALAYMIVSLTALLLAVALVAWAIWA
ncbi:hypothetical protein BV98_001471 [Sphingobium herbicidovorans NBRC 16415]|uniref:Uncharacterized protein n=1 Tax=Sphingobium herbicidovorans (strain ATCC 700291 / DSM 11019 / CCUG 56400 / KCTC 2939 / LMG 18315 / NBRC 16415 / MH) TaxID=1219045 RepID=A0A086PBJ1_SPHHM|nr:hypothetical protein [Sphingobium herbicidovorans]KFG90759.1 hypothetical protein BV98_001471 [Sphingobium herbicidovorans NBRC 16415]